MVFKAVDLLANDHDADSTTNGDAMHIARVGNATYGAVELRADGSVRFMPEDHHHGVASFNYWVADAFGAESMATVKLTLLSRNDAPVALGETLAGVEDRELSIASSVLLGNDRDADTATDGQALHIASVGNAMHGSVELRSDGEVIFTPEANYHGRAGFFYTVSDPLGLQSMAWASIDLAAVNDAPEAENQKATGEEDLAMVFSAAALLAAGSDVDAATDGDTLHMARVGDAVHGTVVLRADGSVRFLPEANYHGEASFNYWMADAHGAEAQARMSITVLSVNDVPVARGETLAGVEDSVLRIASSALLANDSDADSASGQTLYIASVSNATHGTVELRPGGEVAFTPEANYHGRAGFFYTVSDALGLQSTAWASIDLAAVNDAPEVQDDIATGEEDTVLAFSAAALLSRVSDVDAGTDGDTLRMARVGNAVHGTVEMSPDGSVRFMPEANYHGVASFSYWVADASGAESMASVNVTVLAVNDTPTARGDAFGGTEDKVLRIASATLLANDSDPDTLTDGQLLHIARVSNATHGTVELRPDGEVIFTPEPNYHGRAGFFYTVSDPSGLQSSAWASIDLTAVNDAPELQDDTALCDEDMAAVFRAADLLANDRDADVFTSGDAIRISRVGNAVHGTVELRSDGSVRFAPEPDYHGPASFNYWAADAMGAESMATVKLTVLAVNDAPLARGESMDVTEDEVLRIASATLLANDTDADTLTDGQGLRVAGVGDALHGTVELLPDGEVIFKPEENFHGVASFSYVVSDSAGGASTATAVLRIAPVNDAPQAVADMAATDEDRALVLTAASLLANDLDADTATNGDVMTLVRVGEALHGGVTLLPDGNVRFVPDANYHGPASFSYWVADSEGVQSRASVFITVLAVNDLPVTRGESFNGTEDTVLRIAPSTLLANDTDADTATDGQILHIAAVGNAQNGFVSLDVHGQIVFVPQPNHSGVASFQYTVSDGAGGMSIATAMVHLASVNDAPLARGEALTGEEDVALIFEAVDLLRNDSDPDIATDGDALRIARVGEAVHGAVELRADGSVRFVPETNYHGRASFSYWVTDAAGAESRATVQLTVLAVNDLPTARGETFDTTEDGVISIPQSALLGNDSDVDSLTDGQSLSIVSIGNARHGSATLDVNGRIRFLPEVNYHGAASFDYVISDGAGGTATATAVVRVSPLNDAPTPVADATRADEDQVLVFSTASLLANDSDPDMAIGGDVLRVVRVGNATHGTVTLEVGGNVRFVPEANYHGLATFTYWVADVAGSQSQAQVTIRLDPINDLPVLQGEIIEGSEDITLRIDPALLLANDTDVDIATDAQGLAITAVESGTHGSATLRWDGKIVFSPETDFSGRASFSYRVTDGAGGEVWAMAFVDLAAVNDAPVVRGEIVRATEDVALAINPALLLANDSDKDNPWSDLRIVSVGNATHGTVTLDAAGALHFVPVADYFGSASFDYTVGDGAGGFTVGTATIEIAPVNDAPVLVGETMTLDEDTQARFTTAALLANDADVDDAHATLSLTAVGNAAGGSVALVGGEIVFTPTLNRYGPASFTYTVSDAAGEQRTASVNLDFTSVNDKPVVNGETFVGRRNTTYTFTQAALLANDTDVEDPAGLRIVAVGNAAHGTATRMGDGSIRFTPQAGFTGTGSFDYVVEDPGGGRSTATTTIDFSRVNTAPVATDDGFIGFEDVAFRIAAAQLLVNDRDDEDPSLLRVTAVANGSNGSVSLDASGNVNFVPTANYSGGASFNYLVSDSDGASTWATAYLTVQSVNDAPVIEDIWYGRPFYGYRKEVHRDLDWGTSTIYVKVTDSATALAVLASGQSLYLQQNTSTTYAPSYYRNGMLKPVSIDPLDATHEFYLSDNGPYYTPMNDRFRQNGAVVAYDPDGNSAALTFSIGSAPQHGHAWTNRYIPSNVSEYIDHTQAAPFWIGERGAWQYYSRRGDSYSGGDPFTISVTDSGGATTRISINAVHAGSNIGGGGGCPIVIDLSDDGIDLIRPEDSNVFMDINGDGWRDRIGWAAPSDAVLVLDGNQDGRVDIDHEVSFVDHLPGARTDLEGLVAHDSDGDGRLTAADDRWKEFGLFQDRNRNGLQDEGEFISLDAAGLRSLSLLREGTPEMNQGNVVFGTSVIEWADGRISRAGDVMFAGDGVPLPEAAQMALLFSQLAALPALAEPAGAAVFLPPHAESMTDEWVVAASAATTPTPMAVSA
jgi:acylphosphatase